MGRTVRMVPADWQHPKNDQGHYIPLLEGPYDAAAKDWDESWRMWQQGKREAWGDGEKWVDRDDRHTGTYTEYAGARPSPDDYMPDWPTDARTHFMMYEDTSEGTPISPAFDTPEKLARWLADNGASGFGSSTASYEDWLSTCKRGWAPRMIMQGGVLSSGVEALA